MTAFFLKLFACLAMLVDHIAVAFEPQLSAVSPWLYVGCRMFGRLAFPIFALGIAEGTTHTSNPKKYLARMFLFAIIAQVPFSLMMGTQHANATFMLFGHQVPLYLSFSVMVTLFLGLAVCVSIHEGKHFGGALALAAAFLIDQTVGMDYGLLGVLFIVALYLSRETKLKRFITTIIFSMLLFLDPLKVFLIKLIGDGKLVITTGVLLFMATAFSAFIMLLYNKREGQKAKLFTYFFYPVHMLLIWILWFVYQVV